ncbi:tRNA (cytidine(56)-2'-O)-methyltransferase [Candidatus Micrarchaeota archaeon CG_4_10_14_0_2_um_filter_49_7]|nr:MAG: hypothetical protein AUJ13_01320 [Candidatus Micrarchaeota archaeon CG1_02_49_24]PIZ99995.1 MAG: tRNA (cytidine(56)-2'-O)-methyltransferase [Candidatus Micrarchaeota archaeon CG_4_10_14_0_2_um_filter_49_7]HII53357.1 tRNA (cytidine(56)-2'-O)-methyltransferase [Candidatus Micrarchaeota archaeon]
MIIVLRLGHRIERDKRTTTHVSLVARAFLADEVIITGERDEHALETVRKIAENWGGTFKTTYEKNWQPVVKRFKEKGFALVHLTMYGLPLPEVLAEIKKNANLLIIVGGEKVPSGIYKQADFNVSVTFQPHSEIAALAVFLDRYRGNLEAYTKNFGGQLRIVPMKSGKKVISAGKSR